MPSGNEYRCKACNEEVFILPKYLNIAPFPEQWVAGPPPDVTLEEREQRRGDIQEWIRLHEQTFICDPCELILSLPKQIDRVTWDHWKRENLSSYRPYTDYRFLVKLAYQVNEALAASSECVMDFGRLACPYCSQMLASKNEPLLNPLSPKCTRCGSADIEYLGSGIATMKRGFLNPWPPIV